VLSGTRPTITCLAMLVALCVAGELTRTWIAQLPHPVDPPVAYWLRVSGLTDMTHSGWFIFVLLVLILNLFCRALDRLPQAWSDARGTAAPLPARAEGCLRSEIETGLDRDALLELVRSFGKKELGSVTLTTNPGDDALELAMGRGRFSGLWGVLAHLALVLAVAGAAECWLCGFQGRLLIEEGARSHAVEMIRGQAPRGWEPYTDAGRPLDGYLSPEFSIERAADATLSRDEALLRFYDRDQLVATQVLALGAPVRFRGLALHLTGNAPASAKSVNLAVTERKTRTERRFVALTRGQSQNLEDFNFRILEIQPETDLNGPAVQIEYQESGHPAEQFWVFRDYPDYDFAHRKGSLQNFTVESVRQRTAAEILIGREPGAMLIWIGMALFALGLWIAKSRPRERIWIRWAQGQVRVFGWSSEPVLFKPRFDEIVERLEHQLEGAKEVQGAV
jgi:cytochrome c biogenesis protein